MFNKLHYDAKFIEMLAPADLAGGAIDTGDSDVYVRDADRVAVLVSGLVAGTADQTHTITVYKCAADGTGDVAIPFDISEIDLSNGAYGTWTEATTAGFAVTAAMLTEATHTFMIEVDKAQFIGNDDYATNLSYLAVKLAGTDDTATWTGGITAILYGLKYQNTV